MVLARTGDDVMALGTVQSAAGVGGLVGGLLLSLWGGPKRRIHGVLVGWTLTMAGLLLLGLADAPVEWAVAGFLTMFFMPIINGSNQAIWQVKVAPDIQGRVFGVRRLIAQVSWPLAALFAGAVADRVFEPAMRSGPLAERFGSLIGTGPGAGMALMFVLSGLLGLMVGLLAYAVRMIREVENLLPDNQPPAAPPQPELEGA
jgi:hypothetical protein